MACVLLVQYCGRETYHLREKEPVWPREHPWTKSTPIATRLGKPLSEAGRPYFLTLHTFSGYSEDAGVSATVSRGVETLADLLENFGFRFQISDAELRPHRFLYCAGNTGSGNNTSTHTDCAERVDAHPAQTPITRTSLAKKGRGA